jgi:hypothetical protein
LENTTFERKKSTYRLPALAVAAILIAISAGCSPYVSPSAKNQEGIKTVCILYNETAFKNRVVEAVKEKLSGEGFTVVTDRVGNSSSYPAAHYGAVVYMAEYQVWHVPLHQKRYFNTNNHAANIIFVTTSGDPNMRITKPFDAITSASTDARIQPVTQALLDRLGVILRQTAPR